VITVGFDWKVDTPERMRQFAAGLGMNDVPNWHFLATEAGVVDKLSENLGFLFYPSAKGFDHLAQATVIDADGKIYRQIYGVDVETTALFETLNELVFNTPRSAGFIAHWMSTFRLFCTVYDPNNDRYRSRPGTRVHQVRGSIRVRVRPAKQPFRLAGSARLVFLLDRRSDRRLPVYLL
jgi:protein SCO1/2